ncbi:MAG: cell division protein FtsQ/DivIB, partial [Steroidobacteraceae bacterium]
MSRTVLIALAVGCITALIGATTPMLRRLDVFRVRRVEVVGTRYLMPHEALRASGIARASNVFDDPAPWRRSLEQHPLIKRSRIERQLPGTIRLVITEAEPIALIAAPELRVITAEGELLPVDPTEVDFDLPVIAARVRPEKGWVSEPRVLTVLKVLARVRAADAAMFGWISDVEPARAGVRIRLRSPVGAEALLTDAPDAAQLRTLRLT